MTTKEKITRAEQERKALDIYEKALLAAAEATLADAPDRKEHTARAIAMAEILDAMNVQGAKNIQAQAGIWLALQLHSQEVRNGQD